MVHKQHEKHHIQTKLFSMIPLAVKFDLFHGHCENCQAIMRSRMMYLLKKPKDNMLTIKYLCSYCASLHEEFIRFLIITKN